MATPIEQKLQEELDTINATYEAGFSGQSRATRDLSKLDALVSQTRSLLARVEAIPAAARGPQLSALFDTATAQIQLFQAERVQIERAKKAGPSLERFSPLATGANFVFAKYTRHFAGQSRNTRDLELLDEMIDDLQRIDREMTEVISKTPSEEFRADQKIVRDNLDMYKTERGELLKAQLMGTTLDQAGLLATLANSQFELYRVHFANQSRLTRRPALLTRLITSLERIQKAMKEIEGRNANIDFNKPNIDIVSQNLEMYRAELQQIKQTRESNTLEDLMGNLGDAANALFAEYRENFAGKNRTTVDPKILVAICDKLHEVYRQMRDLKRMKANEMNDKNLEIVTDQLSLFNREFDLITEAQKGVARPG